MFLGVPALAVQTIPAQPVAGREFVIFLTPLTGGCRRVPGGQSNVAGLEITVTFDTSRCNFLVDIPGSLDFPVGSVARVDAAGGYDVIFNRARVGSIEVKPGPAVPAVQIGRAHV